MNIEPKQRSIYTNLSILIARGAIVFAFLYLAYLFYDAAIGGIFDRNTAIVSFVLLWLFTAYVFLPRVHRFLTRLYLPDYYIGRTKTPDGLLADPVNIALCGSRQDIISAMEADGWVKADRLNLSSGARMLRAGLTRQSYPNAPVSTMLLFDRPQDFTFQKEVDGSVHARHHVRFWRTPKEWMLPGGYQADWLAAATYDRSVGLSLFTGQITHKIDEDTDQERDFVVKSFKRGGAKLEIKRDFNTAYRHRNGGGDSIKTDGAMPFIYLD